MTLQELEHQIHQLSPVEKVQVLQTLFHDLTGPWPGIEKNSSVMGGDACLVRTRIPVWMLEGYRRLGWTEAEILDNYPTLSAADLVQAWGYVAAHPEEIEQALQVHAEA
jgi:uncharacterized protein (DUF433 family)